MKKIFILLLISFFITNINAQNIKADRVPDSIKKQFNLQFPDVKKVKWKRVEALFFAQFSINGKGVDVTYKLSGEWIETLTEISISEVPAEVVTGINNIFTGAKIIAAASINQSTKEILYVVQLKCKGKKTEMTLDAKGNQVS